MLAAEAVEGRVARLRLLIEQHRMALRKRAALRVLSGQPHAVAFLEQRAEGERLTGRPVETLTGFDRLSAVIEKPLDRLVHMEVRRNDGDFLADLAQLLERDAGIAAARVFELASRFQSRPAAIEPVRFVRF